MEQVLDTPPALTEQTLKGGTRLTRRWSHGELHAALPPLDTHVVMTYYGTAQKALWRQGKQRVESRTRRGSITLIPEGQDGRWDVDGPIEVSHVYLPGWRLESAAEAMSLRGSIELVGRNCFDDPTSAQILEILSKEAETGDTSATLFVEQAVDLLCTQLLRSHSSHAAMTATTPRRGLADWQIKRVNDYMVEFMDREIGLDELAGLVQLSRFHFCASFKLATGMTPHEWLTAIRMRRACELLSQTDWPIINIALEVGYATPSAFSASFRKTTNATPSAYRRSSVAV
ncbi:transcriptional regulator, AraC family [Ancylobacter novellus DSM 506]|uniref:Transcriptional regulator, AraC family n=2 Tax=Ancylobacter novellus TaxID=921 RepID=D7A583_ANCN5|nr:transcriptional regulator, AraC family [Ancylobacter novellus DSM 506]